MKRFFYGSAILAALVAVVLVVVGWQFVRFLDAPLDVPASGITYDVPPGTSFAALSNDLANRGVISHPTLFRWYARLTGDAGRIHAGEYRLEPGMTPPQLLEKLVSGSVLLHSFTIVEGWNYRNLLEELHRHEAVTRSMSHDDWPQFLEQLGSDADHPEGLFLPETYRFAKGARDVDILTQAYGMMSRVLASEWPERADGLPLDNPYEALILASIIERETARDDERARIAGVFVRRLQKGMRLQTDPTVIYGIGPEFDGNLTRRDLQTSTPYNTYTQAGLPPTPIAMPGHASIHAALHPAPGDELFFVATGFPDGSHKFSRTVEEHEAAVAEYLVRLRETRRASGTDGDGAR